MRKHDPRQNLITGYELVPMLTMSHLFSQFVIPSPPFARPFSILRMRMDVFITLIPEAVSLQIVNPTAIRLDLV